MVHSSRPRQNKKRDVYLKDETKAIVYCDAVIEVYKQWITKGDIIKQHINTNVQRNDIFGVFVIVEHFPHSFTL